MKKAVFFLFVALFVWGAVAAQSMSSTTSAATIAPQNGCYVGVFREGAPQNMGHIKSFEKSMAKTPSMVMWYLDYTSDFPTEDCNKVTANGAIPQIIWEPWVWGEEDKIKLKNITSGEWDTYIEKWAKAAKAYNKPVFVRWGHEFNIEKYPWGIGNNGKDPALYVKAYRHVHDIFTKAGASNVKWIWCFNNYPNPDENWNTWDQAYPGDEYVDWVGIDGYNWGSSQSWSNWQSFKDLFRDQVREASKKYPDKPVMIAEFGSTEDGGNKAAWIKEIPNVLKTSMKQVKAIMLFDVKKECDWRSSSCKQTEDAYKAIFKDPYFLNSSTGFDTVKAVSLIPSVKKVAVAKKTLKPIKMDGVFTPFAQTTPIVLDSINNYQEGTKWKGWKDLSSKIYLMWDAQYLYVYAKVIDNMPLTNSKTKGEIWNGDGIEICMPGYQIGLGAGDGRANKPSIWIWQKNKASAGGQIFTKKLTAQPSGYIIEAKIPWKEIGFFDPSKGKVDFDIAVDDADTTWQRETQLVWSGDYLFYKDPDVWGELRLSN
jgi:beta-mannanase